MASLVLTHNALIEKFEYVEESWGFWQEFVKLRNLWNFLVASFFLFVACIKWILAASQKKVFYMWKKMFFPTCTKFYSGFRQEFVKFLTQFLSFFNILEFFYECGQNKDPLNLDFKKRMTGLFSIQDGQNKDP